MLKGRKIVAVVILILLLFSSIQNIVYAVTLKQDVNLYDLGECEYTLQYKRADGKWSYITCHYVVYQENGKTYPAYCINKEYPGVGEISSYNVNLESLIDDVRLWRVAINGFPYKSAAELGVYNDYDAFLATKQAVYSVLYNYDVDNYYRGGNERGEKMHEAVKRMVYEGRYGTYTPQSANVTVNKTGNLKDEGDYYSQEYTVSSRVEMSQYTITNIINCPTGAYVSDMSNNAKTTFNGGEHFKLRIPKSSMGADIDVKINAQARCKTYPVFFGRTYTAGTQNYLVTSDPYGDEAGQGTLNVKTNNCRIVVNKTDRDTNAPVPNTTFQLLTTDGRVVANATTNSKGIAEFNGLYQNTYILKEISSNEKYILEENEQRVTLNYGETKTYNITNKHKEGNLKITKVDKDNHNVAIGGVVFDLFSKEYNRVIGTYTTNVNGEITVNNLRIGDYSLIEKSTNKWYNLADNTDVKVEWNSTKNQTIENELKKGQIRIIKVDKDNNAVKLAGVKFNVLDEKNRVLETVITDSNGEALTSRYPIRDYSKLKIQECETLWNYELNNEIKTIELKEEQILNVTFENELKKGQVKVIKVDKDNNEVKLAGVEFKIYDENNNLVDTLVTDKNGEAISKKLRIDREYTIKETKTLSNYVLNEETKTLKLKENQITNIVFTNELKKGQIKVIKVDFDNNEIKLKGVEFKVLDESGNIVDTLITDENGEAISKRLPINQEYRVQESKTLENYVLNEEIKTITLKQDQITDITFTNELKKGQIRIIKVDLYNNEVKLQGVEFNLLDESGNVIEKLITDENGVAVSKRHRIDKKYTLQEVKTLEKYDLNEEIKTIILEQDQIKDIEFTNELKKGQIRVIKVDLDDNEVKLKGVEFNVLDETGNVVDTLITDENGEAVSKLLKVNQKYTIKETKTLENYVLNEETKVVTLQPAEITSVTFENEKIKGYIQITKTSSEYNKYSELEKGSPLPDVTFEVYDFEDNLVDTITTDKEGKAITKELLKGCYKIKEISSAKYYLLNENIYNAEIIKDQEIVNIDITNDNVEIDVEVEKNGFIETQSKDDIFYNFKNIKNKSNVPLDNFTWSDHLPTDAVRINRLYTGTWNEELEYDVYYKTNKSEEYVLFKENLNTQKIYELNFKELTLQEDEYVTDYEFRFGTVKIGFQEEESPILYCDIVDGLGNGYVFTNNTKVKGTYFAKEVEDNDNWTTITYYKEIKVDEILPKTRFIVIDKVLNKG